MPPVKRNKGNADELHSASAQVNVSADRMNIQQTSNQAAAAAGRPREIPDSQEDPDEAALSDNDQAADLGGYDTEEDETPANSKKAIVSEAPADAKKAVYTLKAKGIGCNGRLAADHPDNEGMAEIATQPSTQPHLDARRLGNNSISEDDAADVICILHPASKDAYRAIEIVARQCPQHILQNEGLEYLLDYDTSDQDASASTRPDLGSQESQGQDVDAQLPSKDAGEIGTQLPNKDGPIKKPGKSAKDIALRLSSKVHNPLLGFTFGRNPLKCDIPIATVGDDLMRISNAHFRIYINAGGILMCEDTSRNGTWVDAFELRAKSSDANIDARRTINTGTMITIIHDGPLDPMRFVVTIPERRGQEAAYTENLDKYRATLAELERQATIAAQAAATGNIMGPPALFTRHVGVGRAPIPARTFAASTMPFNHGMSWNGGDRYNVVGHVGKGAFANVYKLSTKANGDLIAAKEIEKRKYLKDGILDRKAHNEIEIMRNVNHDNIVQYLGYHETDAHLYMLMEFVPCGDLTQFVHRNNLLPEPQCQCVAYQTMQALDYLHKKNITHRDIKPDNILIASGEPMLVKLSDFGLSKVVTNDDSFLKTFCGTLLYCAPEIYPGYENAKKGKSVGKRSRHEPQPQTLPYQQSVDTWAFGAVMYHLLCGVPPYSGSPEHKGQQMLQSLMSKPVNWDRLNQAGITPNGCDFVKRMLVHEPGDRASDADCLGHAWLAHLRPSEEEDVEMQGQDEGLSAIPEETDEAQELDASQLSLHDPTAEEDDGLEYDDSNEVEEMHGSKRVKTDCPRPMGFVPRTASGVSLGSDYDGSYYDTFPMFINAGSRPVGVGAPTRGSSHNSHRLFGEIGASAFGSSGVFGQGPLPVVTRDLSQVGRRQGNYGNYGNHGNHGNGSREGSVAMSDADPDDDTSLANTESHVTNDEISEHSLQYPQLLPATTYAGPAPSLLGTEALVGQLNMASSDSVPSAPSDDGKSATPRTPKTREQSPVLAAVAGSKRSGPNAETTGQHEPLKRSRKGRDAHHVRRGSSHSHDSSASHALSKASKTDRSNAPIGDNLRAEAQADHQEDEGSKSQHSHRSHRASSSNSASHSPGNGKEDDSRRSRRSHRDSPSKPTADVAEAGKRPASRQPRPSHRDSSSKSTSETARVGKEPRAQEPRQSRRSASSKTTAHKVEVSKERTSDRSHRSHRGSSSKSTPDLPEGENVSGSHRSDRQDRDSTSRKALEKAEADPEEVPRRSHRSVSKTTRKESVRTSVEETQTGSFARGNGGKEAKGSVPKEKKKQDQSSKNETTKASNAKSQKVNASTDSQNGSANSSNSSEQPVHQASPPDDSSFVRPPPIFGKLTTLPHSVITTTIKLSQRLTYYGRGENCTVFYPNHMDIRVPRNAFDITFWRPGLERDLAKGHDWTKDGSIQAIISTRTTRWIMVNGIKVTRGADCWQFGRLYTGDVITVFDDKADGKPSTDFFKLECNFNIGLSKAKRPDGEPFVVEQERDHYQKVYGESSRKQAKEEKKKAREEAKTVEMDTDASSEAMAIDQAPAGES